MKDDKNEKYLRSYISLKRKHGHSDKGIFFILIGFSNAMAHLSSHIEEILDEYKGRHLPKFALKYLNRELLELRDSIPRILTEELNFNDKDSGKKM